MHYGLQQAPVGRCMVGSIFITFMSFSAASADSGYVPPTGGFYCHKIHITVLCFHRVDRLSKSGAIYMLLPFLPETIYMPWLCFEKVPNLRRTFTPTTHVTDSLSCIAQPLLASLRCLLCGIFFSPTFKRCSRSTPPSTARRCAPDQTEHPQCQNSTPQSRNSGL